MEVRPTPPAIPEQEAKKALTDIRLRRGPVNRG